MRLRPTRAFTPASFGAEVFCDRGAVVVHTPASIMQAVHKLVHECVLQRDAVAGRKIQSGTEQYTAVHCTGSHACLNAQVRSTDLQSMEVMKYLVYSDLQ